MTNKTLKYLLLWAALLFGSCTREEPQYPHSPRVLLVYVAGDNNLSGYVQDNLDDMTSGMASAPAGTRTLVYLDLPGQAPRLAEATASGVRTLHTWPAGHNSASVAVMREVFALTRQMAPADRYGLVLWSHGLAWMPSWATDYLRRSALRTAVPWPERQPEVKSPEKDAAAAGSTACTLPIPFAGHAPATLSLRLYPETISPAGKTPNPPAYPAACLQTKWFGQDTGENPAGYLETADLTTAIPAGMFDYILFDACFMGSAETLYELRDKTPWVVCSPAEVLANGFPYDKITAELLKASPDLRSVCETYYRHYAEDPRPEYRSATVALVNTSELEALANATAKILGAALAADPDALPDMDLSALQPLDRYRRHFLFDMGSVVDRLESLGLVPVPLLQAWHAQLARTVTFEAHTPQMLDLPLTECCGLSMYVPVRAYGDLNGYYATLGWYGRCYPAGGYPLPHPGKDGV